MLANVVAITALAGIGGTGLGAVCTCLFHRDSNKVISLLLSFAAGVMTAVVCFDLLTDALLPDGMAEKRGLVLVIAGVLAGYAVVWILNTVVNACRKETKTGPLFWAGVMMAAAIALHNVPEGMVIGAAFAGKAQYGAPAAQSGILMATVIGLHNVPEGMAVAVPLASGRLHRLTVIFAVAMTGAPTVLGAVLGYFLGGMGPLALTISLSAAAGAMLYVVFGELLPEATIMWDSRVTALAAVIGMMIGLVIVYA